MSNNLLIDFLVWRLNKKYHTVRKLYLITLRYWQRQSPKERSEEINIICFYESSAEAVENEKIMFGVIFLQII